MKESGKKSRLWLVAGLAGFFVVLSFGRFIFYSFSEPIGYILGYILGKIEFPALLAGALLGGGPHSINWIVFCVALFCIYIIIFSVLIFVFQIVFAKVVKRRNH